MLLHDGFTTTYLRTTPIVPLQPDLSVPGLRAVSQPNMAYIAPIHRPSSIRHALKLNFLAADEDCLVVA